VVDDEEEEEDGKLNTVSLLMSTRLILGCFWLGIGIRYSF
jgi:hypothetical protein